MHHPLVASMGVLLVGGALYLSWDNWWVNWDGGFYLYLAQSLNLGEGFTLPDGSLADFRGPGYPGLFAAGWVLLDVSAKSAIWMSRAALLSAGAVVAWVVTRRGSFRSGLIAGLAAVVPALVLESGGWYFVPDGLAIVLILVSIAVVTAPRFRDGVAAGILAGALSGAAALTKETALLYVPVVMLLIWTRKSHDDENRVRGLGAFTVTLAAVIGIWLFWLYRVGGREVLPLGLSLESSLLFVMAIALAGLVLMFANAAVARLPVPSFWRVGLWACPVLFLTVAGSLWLLGEPTVVSPGVGLQEAGVRIAYLFGWSWVPAALLVAMAMAVGRHLEPTVGLVWLAGVLLIAVGAGQIWYAGAAALSPRNGVGSVAGLALVIGSLLSSNGRHEASGARWRWFVASALVTSIAFVVVSGWSTNSIDSTRPSDGRGWDNEAVDELRSWLADVPNDSVLITPLYATYLYFLDRELPRPVLVPWHFARQGAEQYSVMDFCTRIWWAGELSECPEDRQVRLIQANRRIVSVLFGRPRDGDRLPLVVTGNSPSGSAFNGTGLLSLIEKYDLGELLFATSEVHLPNWAVVYDIDWDRWNSDSIPALLQADVEGINGLVDNSIPWDLEEAFELLVEVLPP